MMVGKERIKFILEDNAMKLKRSLALCLILALAVSLAACGSKEGAVYVQSVE